MIHANMKMGIGSLGRPLSTMIALSLRVRPLMYVAAAVCSDLWKFLLSTARRFVVLEVDLEMRPIAGKAQGTLLCSQLRVNPFSREVMITNDFDTWFFLSLSLLKPKDKTSWVGFTVLKNIPYFMATVTSPPP